MHNPHYEQVGPPPALSDKIECFWRLLMPLVVAPDEVISAEGRAEILFQFEGQSQVMLSDPLQPFDCASSWLMRPFAHALRVRQVGVSSSAMIGVRFSPAGWAAFQHTHTTDEEPYSVMPLRDFYSPAEVRVLEEQLYHALHTPNWAYPLVAFFMRRRTQHPHADRITYAAAGLRRQQFSVAALAHDVNLSERQFGRVFRELVGLSPKQFSRIARLDRVLRSSASGVVYPSLDHLAGRYGYHDASHLIHEFRALIGLSPTAYFSGYYDLIEQKFRGHDRFLQPEGDMLGVLTNQP